MNDEPFDLTANYSRYEHAPDAGGWTVSLPHQCGDWDITGEYDKVTRSEAISQLARFIKEATDVLALLRIMKGDPSEFGYFQFPEGRTFSL